MLARMNQQQIFAPLINQAEFQTGLQDGVRFRADGHLELQSRYENGTVSYRRGWEESANHPRAIDPDFAG